MQGLSLTGAAALVGACTPAENHAAAPRPPSAPAAATAPAGTSAAPAGGPVQTLDYGIISPIALYWVAFVMNGKGLLAREGLQTEMTVTRTVAAGLQALVADGGVRVQASGTDAAVRAIEQGGDFAFVGSVMENPAYSFVVSPAIDSPADLLGKAVAVSGPRDGAGTFIRRLLVRNGLDPERVDFIAAGGTPERFAALKAGAVVGTVMGQPNDFQALAEGYKLLARLDVGTYQFLAWTVTRRWARENEDTLVRFLRANAAACRWLDDAANKEEAIALLSAATNTAERFARQTYTLYLEEMRGQVMPTDGRLNVAGLQAVLDVMNEVGDLPGGVPPVEKLVDLTYQQKALRG